MRQFGRQLKLVIGSDKQSLEITNLRVTFEVKKTLTPEPNPAVIRIYNLCASHRNLLTSKEFNRASLSVGYEELRQIYAGDIVEANTLRDGEDFISELICGDGFKAYTSSVVNKTLSAGKSDAEIMKESTQSMGIETGVVDLLKDRQLPRGKVMFGDPRELLHKIAKNNDAQWSIQDGQMTVLPKDKVLADNEGFVLSQETGMVGSPEKTDDGLSLTCLCNPSLRIGGLVRVQSIMPEYNGDYKITELSHEGDFLGDDWYSQITCIGGRFKKVEK
ncbi:hypothetical protein OQ435_16295 [Proteus penneri]|uniref:phage protein n=1 Tax=Proteus penneri TaxID=102862 RepID=UPI002245B559|nr:hypothetical protein [Proteus penneri]MCX2589732.1 hypothetical protein [Proteus penneri]